MEEEEEEEEEISEPRADLIDGVGDTDRLDAADTRRPGKDGSRDADLFRLLLLLLPMRFSVRLVLLVGQGPELEALSTRKNTTKHKAETKQ